jgi:hypothetical protein
MTDTEYSNHTPSYHHTNDDHIDKYHGGQVADPSVKIEILRKRVEAQLQALMQGSDFQVLRQQVAELRQPHPDAQHPLDENSVLMIEDSYGMGHEESTGLTQQQQQFNQSSSSHMIMGSDNGSYLETSKPVPMDDRISVSSVSDILSTVTTSTMATTASINSAIVPRAIEFVQNVELRDPYGDLGTYTGEVIVHPAPQPHGTGYMKYHDGRYYSGGWYYGQWHGKGTC